MALLTIDTQGSEVKFALHARAADRALDELKPRLAKALAAEMILVEPHGHGGLREHTMGFVTPTGVKIGVFGLPYARAQDRGAYIVASGADDRFHRSSGGASGGGRVEGGPRVLAFMVDGERVFRTSIRIPATHYFAKALAEAPAVIDLVSENVLGDLGWGKDGDGAG